jgi:HAD superfamily hydrolase (TIGR01549 family)
MRPTTVLFDLDDTLFDHRHARRAALAALRQAHPPLARFPFAHMDRTYERILREVHLSRVLTGQLSLEESRRLRTARFLAELGLRIEPNVERRLSQIRQSAYQRNRRAVPGAPALLRFLRASGIRVGIVTNNLRAEQEEKLRLTGLAPSVDVLVCSEQVGFNKPDPRIFRAALAEADATARTTVMVGDSWESDIVGAARLGIRPVWLNRDHAARPRWPAVQELRSLRPLAHASAVLLGASGRTTGPARS